MKAWVFGDDVDTDAIAPGRYMKFGIDEIARHSMEALAPGFAGSVEKGDFVVAGNNFGAGSSREQAAEALKHLGIAALVAESYAGLFYRNAVNLGLPAVVCPQARRIRAGDELRLDLAAAVLENVSTGERLNCEPIPAFLLQIIRDGGLLPHLEKRLRCPTTS